jgi:AraC-like DNA-binding protein
MRGTGEIEQFTSDPVGRYLVGGSWVHWCAHAELFGVVLWGRPSGSDVETLVQSLRCELGVAPHQSLVDASRLGSVDADTFELLTRYVRDHHEPLSRSVTRLALVRPEGLAGAVASGFFGVLDAPYPVQLFADAREAMTWLDSDADEKILQELGAIYDEAAEAGPLLSRLRLFLADHLGDADVAGAARAMKLSDRSLQRRLKEIGTTFQGELVGARVREAQRRMLDTDAPLTRIALDSGFATLQHFSGQFRRVTGESPSTWRSRHRQ